MFRLDGFLRDALAEDIGWGDITTEACVSPTRVADGSFIAKEDLVLCGTEALIRVFQIVDSRIQVSLIHQDGESIYQGAIIATIHGPARGILTGERTALNLLQHLSGIATRTRAAIAQIEGTKTKICDTRKTTPGMRVLEKYAVRTGGGVNHRLGLSDGILIKDNHIRAAGGIKNAVKAARALSSHTLKIEVEAANLDETWEALEVGADIIMLDNMPTEDMRKAVEIIGDRALVEASGNMGDKELRAIAETGVDYISIGALTHSVRASDISLRFDERFL